MTTTDGSGGRSVVVVEEVEGRRQRGGGGGWAGSEAWRWLDRVVGMVTGTLVVAGEDGERRLSWTPPHEWTLDDLPDLLAYRHTPNVQYAVNHLLHQVVNEVVIQLEPGRQLLHQFQSLLPWTLEEQPQSAAVQLDPNEQRTVNGLILQLLPKVLPIQLQHPTYKAFLQLRPDAGTTSLSEWMALGQQLELQNLQQQAYEPNLQLPGALNLQGQGLQHTTFPVLQQQAHHGNPLNVLASQLTKPVQQAVHQLVHQLVHRLMNDASQQMLQQFREFLTSLPNEPPQPEAYQLNAKEEMIVNGVISQLVQNLPQPEFRDTAYFALLQVRPEVANHPHPGEVNLLLQQSSEANVQLPPELNLPGQDPPFSPSQQAGVGCPPSGGDGDLSEGGGAPTGC